MSNSFNLLLTYKGKNLTFPSKLVVIGYTFRILVDVDGTEVIFEPDEEKNYRAILNPEKNNGKDIDVGLLKSIVEAIEQIGEQIKQII